jgi:hypothetical protein
MNLLHKIINGSAVAAICLFTSCASLYTAPSASTPFMQPEQGIAAQGSIGGTSNHININASATKAVQQNVSVHASIGKSILPRYADPYNPFKAQGSKSDFNICTQLGWELTSYLKYPLQLWAGIQYGNSRDSYLLLPGEKPFSKNFALNTSGIDTQATFQYLKGNYIALPFSITAVWLSNYENDPILKKRKKVFFDIIGTPQYTHVWYRYNNANTLKWATNNILSINNSIRFGNKKHIVTLNHIFMLPGKELTDEIFGQSRPTFNEFATSNFYIGYTFFIKGK